MSYSEGGIVLYHILDHIRLRTGHVLLGFSAMDGNSYVRLFSASRLLLADRFS